MKKLGLVVALSTALLQADTFTGAKIVSSDPTGACSDATTLYVSTASGKIFLCSQGQYAAPNPTLATSPTTVLTLTTNPLPAAKDTVTLNVSEDAYQGDALFSASIDGQQLSASTKVTSIRRNGQTQNIAFTGNWGAGPHTVKVTFLNDAWDGNTAPNDINDRNLYVNSVSYNSVSSSVDRTN